MMIRWVCCFSVLGLLAGSARGEVLVMKDGTFVEGAILVQTSTTVRVETRFGTRTYNRKDIEQIVKTPAESQPDAVNSFADLPPVMRAVLNAEAEYALGQYDKAMARIEPFKDYSEGPGIRQRIDWLIIEINQRLGHWDVAREQLAQKKEKGTPREKIRAQAHLDIIEANKDLGLEFVGDRAARNFLVGDDLQALAREPGSLKDARLMRAALEEYCIQLLARDKLSVKAFSEKLRARDTYEAVKKLPRTGDVEKHLPYAEDLQKAEASLYKARSILGDYGSAYELDLLRTEISHLLPILFRMLDELIQISPETFTPPFDPVTGRLTGPGRQQWQQRCDQFLEQSQPVVRIMDYVVDKVERYPRELRDLRLLLTDIAERLDQMIKGVKKAKGRTDA